jgi:hypothetical protein
VAGLERRPFNRVIDAGVFSGVPENAVFGADKPTSDKLNVAVAQRTAAAGLRPPPMPVL